jgi:hypothetical protein
LVSPKGLFFTKKMVSRFTNTSRNIRARASELLLPCIERNVPEAQTEQLTQYEKIRYESAIKKNGSDSRLKTVFDCTSPTLIKSSNLQK